jgi:hypothetical protein
MGRRKLTHAVGPFLARLLGPLAIRALRATWRMRYEPPDLRARVARAEPLVYALWHGGLLVPAAALPGNGTAIMISRHADGEVIARIVERLGFTTVRGSSTRGGATALHEAVDALRAGRPAAFTPDGPKGPRQVARPGAVFAASRAGVDLLPLGVGVKSAWVLGSWDRFRIPRPFTRVALVAGERLRPPPDLGDGDLEAWRARLEAALKEADGRAQAVADGWSA